MKVLQHKMEGAKTQNTVSQKILDICTTASSTLLGQAT